MFGGINRSAKYVELPQKNPDDDSLNIMEKGNVQEGNPGDQPLLEQDVKITHISKQACQKACCKSNSNVGARPTSKGNAILPLASRCVSKKPFIPQSYNYKDFQENQQLAIGQKSLKSTVEIVQEVFSKSLNSKTEKEENLLTNPDALVNSRFFPVTVGLDTQEGELASQQDKFILGPLLDSFAGALLEDVKTVSGKESLLVRASNPTNKKEVIQGRQSAIRLLVADKQFRVDLQEALGAYAKNENDFCSRLTPDATKLPGRIENYLKFSLLDIPESAGKHINTFIRENATVLSVNNCIKTTQDACTAGLFVIIAIMLADYSASLVFPNLYSSASKLMIQAFVSRYIGQTGALISTLQAMPRTETKLTAASLGVMTAAAKIPDLFGYLKADMVVKMALQQKMVNVAKCIRSMRRVYELVQEKPELGAKLEEFDKLEKLMNSSNPKVKKLLDAISSSSLDAPSTFFGLGPVLVGWTLLLDKEVRQLVLESIVAFGEIDANLTLAQKIVESTPERPYCIPEIVEGDCALLDLKGAHFPPLSMHSTNSANKDAVIDLPPLSIITAETGSGKTTFSVSWMNILLSTQSLGIAACAEGSRVSIFDTISTSMGVTDNNVESSNEAHERYAEELLANLENHPDKKVFVLLDELFRTTHADKGSSKLSALAKKLAEHSDRLKAIFITHFEEFANNSTVPATRYTTRKVMGDGNRMIPSGFLEEGVYEFSKTQTS